MPNICAVAGCFNKGSRNPGISFFSFPKDQHYSELWRKVCKNKNINTKYGRICSVHFRPDSYKEKSFVNLILNTSPKTTRKLRKDAIPTENLLAINTDYKAQRPAVLKNSNSTPKQMESNEENDSSNSDSDVLTSIYALISQPLSDENRTKCLKDLANAEKEIAEELEKLEEENVKETVNPEKNNVGEIQRLKEENEIYFSQLLKSKKREAFWKRSCYMYKMRADYAESHLNYALREKCATLSKLK